MVFAHAQSQSNYKIDSCIVICIDYRHMIHSCTIYAVGTAAHDDTAHVLNTLPAILRLLCTECVI